MYFVMYDCYRLELFPLYSNLCSAPSYGVHFNEARCSVMDNSNRIWPRKNIGEAQTRIVHGTSTWEVVVER